MAKTRTARGGRKSKKTAKKSARRPKPARAKAKAGRQARKAQRGGAARRPARPVRKTGKKATKKAVKKAPKKTPKKAPARKAQARKPAARKAPLKKAAAPKKAAPKKAAPKKAPARQTAPQSRRAEAAAAVKRLPNLDRERRRLAETDEELMPSAPSTLGYERGASAARTGRTEMNEARTNHTSTGPELTGGDVDANWEDAYSVGDEAPGGDNPTPDQDRVDDIGKALGVQYDDNEELKGAEKIIDRDRHRWELDPASSDDYVDRRNEED